MIILNVITDKRREKLRKICDVVARREQIRKYIVAELCHTKVKADNAVIAREVARLDMIVAR